MYRACPYLLFGRTAPSLDTLKALEVVTGLATKKSGWRTKISLRRCFHVRGLERQLENAPPALPLAAAHAATLGERELTADRQPEARAPAVGGRSERPVEG